MWGKEVSPETCVALLHKAGNTRTSSYDTVETRRLKRESTRMYTEEDVGTPQIQAALLSKYYIPDLTVKHDSDVESAGPNPLCSQSGPQKSSC